MAKPKTSNTSSSQDLLLSSWQELRADWTKTGIVTVVVMVVLVIVFYWLRVR